MTGKTSPIRSSAARLLSGTLWSWLLVSTLEQLRSPGLQRLRRFDACGLVPVWTFFAPRPATGDYYLVYRDELSSRALTTWTEAAAAPPRRPVVSTVWNPDRRAVKALFDVSSALAVQAQRCDNPDAIQLSLPYLTLLNFVVQHPRHPPGAVATQFMVLSDHGLGKASDPEPVFLSRWHSL